MSVPQFPIEKADFHVFDCPGCECTYLSPRMTEAGMKAYYASGAYLDGFKNYSNFGERRRALTRMNVLMQFTNIQKPDRALDYGCGEGHFLMRMRDLWRDVETVGYDLHRYPNAVHDVITDKDKITGTFNMITCLHVLEHTYDPMAELSWMWDLLEKDGVLMLELPVVRKIMVEHPVTFHYNAVPLMMDKIGCENYTRMHIPAIESVIVLAVKP